MANELAAINPLSIVSAELYRSYILAGRKKDAPEISDLSEQAGAIIAQNAREPRPVPPGTWGDLFQFARRKWSLCGYGELMRAWDGEEFPLWQAERRRVAQKAAAEAQPKEQEQPAETVDFVDVWADAWTAGEWVPDFMIGQLAERFGQRKNLCNNS
jgi:hypothetical protein